MAARSEDSFDDALDMLFEQKRRRCCFWIPTLRSPAVGSGSGSSWERIRPPEMGDRWWWRALKRVKEWSEVVAGPRWKTFIRRFNRNARQNGDFRYDPLSYARNFDERSGQDGVSEEYGCHNFSVRYATLPASAKSSIDLGKDPIDFTSGSPGGQAIRS